MVLDKLVIGAYENNCYIARKDQYEQECVVIDTGLDDKKLIDFIEKEDYKPVALLLTHGHADHIYAIPALRKRFPEIKVYVHKDDAQALMESEHNLSMFGGIDFETSPADVEVEDQQVIEEAGIKFLVMHTPGHSPGGACYYVKHDRILFSGDTLFCESVGRTDLTGGNMDQLIGSIKNKLLALPDGVNVLPGHGPETTIGDEKIYNQYLK